MAPKRTGKGDRRRETSDAENSFDGYVRDLLAYAQDIDAKLGREMRLIPQLLPSNSADSAGELEPERRRGQRVITIHRLVRIESNGDHGMACCRNISDLGARLDLTMPVEVGHRVKVAFSASNKLAGRVVWVKENRCGISFDTEVDSAALLKASSEEIRRAPARAMRLHTSLTAQVCFDGLSHDAIVTDISQRGAKLTHDGTFRQGLSVKVVLPSGTERQGVVRWSKDGLAGVFFIEPFSVAELGSIGALGPQQPAVSMPADNTGKS